MATESNPSARQPAPLQQPEGTDPSHRDLASAGPEPPPRAPTPWFTQRLWPVVALGGMLFWAAHPPLAWGGLSWLGVLCWLLPIGWQELPGKRPYRMLYALGVAHWLLLIQWLRLPHWSALFGWVAASLYLGAYLPAFIGLTRSAIRKLRIPLVLAAPIVWVGLELARGHLVGGFSIFLLAHTQVKLPVMLQVCDLAGTYTLSFLMVMIVGCLASAMPRTWTGFAKRSALQHQGEDDSTQAVNACRWQWKPALLAVVLLGLIIGYGEFRLRQAISGADGPHAKIALLQGAIPTVFGPDQIKAAEVHRHYLRLQRQVTEEEGQVDLIVWPESMFGFPYLTADANPKVPDIWPHSDPEFLLHLERSQASFAAFAMAASRDAKGVPLLVGLGGEHIGSKKIERRNSALLIDPSGAPSTCYNKMSPVIFGEYLPLGKQFPWLYRFSPMGNGLTPGQQPENLDIGGLRLAPSICFEITKPHLIRQQVRQLQAEGSDPQVLVSLSNDGWFHGSAILDGHFNCCVFRAVELRRPVVAAANAGFSGSINGNGEVLLRGDRGKQVALTAEVWADGRYSLYQAIGDLPAGICLLITALAGLCGLGSWRRAE